MEAPVSVIVICAVDVAVPDGTYCTVIVQPLPAAITVVLVQVPPVIEKAPAPAVLVIVGVAVSVSGPANVPLAVLLTVIVPDFVFVPPVFSAGTGALIVTVAPSTVNVGAPAVGVFPIGVVTVTFLVVKPAVFVIANVAVRCVPSGLTVMPLAVIPAPALTTVAPVKPVPIRVTARFVPREPLLGVIEASVGPVTVNVSGLLAPPSVVTVTFLAVRPAVAVIVKVAVTVVSLTTVKLLTVMPAPTPLIADVVNRLVPVKVTGTLVPREPNVGLMELSAGAAGLLTTKDTLLLVPFVVVTETVLVVSAAVVEIANVAVTVVSLTPVTLLTVTPVPETLTPVAPVK